MIIPFNDMLDDHVKKELRALRPFWPPLRPKYKNGFHQLLTITKEEKSQSSLTFTVSMVTKSAAKLAGK